MMTQFDILNFLAAATVKLVIRQAIASLRPHLIWLTTFGDALPVVGTEWNRGQTCAIK